MRDKVFHSAHFVPNEVRYLKIISFAPIIIQIIKLLELFSNEFLYSYGDNDGAVVDVLQRINEVNYEEKMIMPTVQEVVSVTIAQIAIGLMLNDVPDDVLEEMFNQIAVTNGVSKTIFLSTFDAIHGIDYIRALGNQWLESGHHHLSNIINHPINDDEGN